MLEYWRPSTTISSDALYFSRFTFDLIRSMHHVCCLRLSLDDFLQQLPTTTESRPATKIRQMSRNTAPCTYGFGTAGFDCEMYFV